MISILVAGRLKESRQVRKQERSKVTHVDFIRRSIITPEELRRLPKTLARSHLTAGKIAAAFALGGVALLGLHSTSPTNVDGSIGVAVQMAITPDASASAPHPDVAASASNKLRTRQRQLPDGTTVIETLDTRMRLDFSEQRRGIEMLSGNAMFDVAEDQSRPFEVKSALLKVTLDVTAVDTQFAVWAGGSCEQAQVYRGTVSISGRNGGVQKQFKEGEFHRVPRGCLLVALAELRPDSATRVPLRPENDPRDSGLRALLSPSWSNSPSGPETISSQFDVLASR